MNNDEIIEKLTLGKDHSETVTIDGHEITLRPLTAGELAKLQSLEKQGFIMKVEGEGEDAILQDGEWVCAIPVQGSGNTGRAPAVRRTGTRLLRGTLKK